MDTNGRYILVVEDEVLIRFALCDLLVDHGYHVLEAGDALSAIGVFGKAGRIDAVISDIDMPGHLSGLDFVSLVARSAQNIPVIITSGRSVTDIGTLPAGVLFLPKPYDEEELVMHLDQLLQSKEQLSGIALRV
jgi:DNA-binding response OmpR family regulator